LGKSLSLSFTFQFSRFKELKEKMFKPMAQTVIFALLGAFILSLTYIPMMSTLFLSKKN
jgi:Putative silver efflux pump